MKKREWRYKQGGPRYRNWIRLVSWVRRSIRRRSRRIVKFFFSFRDFFGKSRKCHVIGFRMYCKPTKFDQFRWSHFWENRNFIYFFLMWTTLHFEGRSKTKEKKRRREIFARFPRYRIWTRLVSWFRRYVRRRTEN